MDKKKKGLILIVLGIISLVLVTVGVTYAFFNYTKEGTTDNTLTSGTITFLYTEVSGAGRGISIDDALPTNDDAGKRLTGEGKVFDFKITSNTSETIAIPYEITARMKEGSNLDPKAVRIYLTKVNGTKEEEVLLDNYDNLTQTSRVDKDLYIEKTIHTGKVPISQKPYEQNFRLRMWIDEKIDYSPVKDENGNDTYPYNDKEFTINVNVYADGNVDEIPLIKEKKVTFNTDGGVLDISSKTYEENTMLGELPTPTRGLDYFAGWYLDDNFTNPINSDYIITEDLTIYARWYTYVDLNLENRTLGYPSDTNFVNTVNRTYNLNTYVVGISSNNYYVPSNISSYTYVPPNFSVTAAEGGTGYGIGIPISVTANTYYFEGETNDIYAVTFYKSDGEHIQESYVLDKLFTVPEAAAVMLLHMRGNREKTTTYSNPTLYIVD